VKGAVEAILYAIVDLDKREAAERGSSDPSLK
jgi:hypothetical protein